MSGNTGFLLHPRLAADTIFIEDWPLSRVLQIGDHATGTSVLTDMYAKWSEKPVDVDLPALWKELGVSAGPNHGVVLDAKSPLAGIRESLALGK